MFRQITSFGRACRAADGAFNDENCKKKVSDCRLTNFLDHAHCAGDPSFLESVDIYFDKAAAIASTTPDILAQIKVG